MWEVEKLVSKGDYFYAIVRNHPRATKHGYVLHHRIVVENHLNRLLSPDEIVHHINEDGKDNRIENLQVTDQSSHARHHHKKGVKTCVLKCPWCAAIFELRRGQTFLVKKTRYNTCSRQCWRNLSSLIRSHGVTLEVEEAISGNLVSEYVKYPDDNSEEIF